MKKLQAFLVVLALFSLGVGYIFIRGEALLPGQVAVNVGFMAIFAILVIELFKGESDE